MLDMFHDANSVIFCIKTWPFSHVISTEIHGS